MSDLIDKKALIEALNKIIPYVRERNAFGTLLILKHDLDTGEFDAKPEPMIRTLRNVTSCLTSECRFNIKATKCNLRAVRVDNKTRKCLCFEER